jgi:dUTP pyrophosphatase
MRDFEKISFEQFKKDIADDRDLYNEYKLPQRDSDSTAGYDIYLLEDLIIEPNEIKKIPTGIKSFFGRDEVLFLIVRSSTGFKYNIRLCNQVGVIDADYYNNKNNEGHMWIKIQNEGNQRVIIPRGESIVQGIFLNYLTTRSDRNIELERTSDY